MAVLPSWIAYFAPALIVWGTIDYILELHRRKEAVPNLITWFVWSIAPFIALGAQLANKGGAEIALTFVAGFCPLVIFIVGLKQKEFTPTRLDKWCGGASGLALVLWIITGNGIVGVLLSIIADAIGAALTLRKAWRDPTSESPLFFALFAITACITLFTISQWTVINTAFSLYLLVLYGVLFTLVKFKIGTRVRKPASFNDTSLP